MVNVREGQKAVQGRVDRGCDRVGAEGCQRIERYDLVFEFDAAIALFERQHFIEIEGGKAGALDAAQVAATAFYPQNLNRLASEWVGLCDLGAGVAAAEVGDAQIGAKKVRAIAQKLRRIQSAGETFVPAIIQILERGRR